MTTSSGVLLVNLGTPDAPTVAAVRRYLAEFLSDPRVVDLPRWQWLPILQAIVLRTRPPKVAPLYAKIWQREGSPLLVYAKRQQAALQEALGETVRVELAMRYGNPSLPETLDALGDLRRLLVLPLFPHYAAATNASIVDALCRYYAGKRLIPSLRVVNGFAIDSGYIEALQAPLRQRPLEPDEHLIFSCHGLPLRHIREGDPYEEDCRATVRAVAAGLKLSEERWRLCFQSRFGREPWLTPATDETLKMLPAQGIKRVVLSCPGFVCDCLETLEEIGERGRETFLHAGGESFRLLPCPNDDPVWLSALVDLVRRELRGWTERL
ncbi:MAG: ferrochelatase [Magnetococcales bacterium]|nr:ferrochelatase [Magnetococcales bacterium]